MRARPIVAWVLVAVAAVIAAATIFFVGGFARGYGPTTGEWSDGALFALQNGAVGAVLAIVAAVVAIVFAQGIWVRVAAVLVIAGTLLGLAAAGGSAAQARFAEASKAPDCLGQGVAVPPEMQEALDELEHPGWIDTLSVSVDGCASVVRNLSAAQVADAYRGQLVESGWAIEEDGENRLAATRDGYTIVISECSGEAWLAIEEDGAEWTYC